MRAVLAMCLIALPAIGCRIDLDHHEYQDGQSRLCNPQPHTASCAAAVGHAELSYVQANILSPKCAAFSECHGTDKTQDDLNLSSAMTSYMGLVNTPSELDTSRMLVVPGDVNASLLSAMIGAITPAEATPALSALPNGKNGNSIGTMPYNNPTMCCEKIDAVSAWITAGAPNN